MRRPEKKNYKENSSHPSPWALESRLAPALTWEEWSWRSGWINSAVIHARIQDLELSHPNIYPNYDLLECGKGLILWNHSFRISMTWGNIRITNRNVGFHYWSCTKAKGLEPDQQLITQWTFANKTPSGKRWIKKSWGGAEDGGAKYSTFSVFLCFSIVYFLSHFYSALAFLRRTTRVKGRYGGTRTWVGLGCIVWNSQRINLKK